MKKPKSKSPFLDTNKSNLFKRPRIISSTRSSKHTPRASKMLIFTIRSRSVRPSTVTGILTLRLSPRTYPNSNRCFKFTQTKWLPWKVIHFCWASYKRSLNKARSRKEQESIIIPIVKMIPRHKKVMTIWPWVRKVVPRTRDLIISSWLLIQLTSMTIYAQISRLRRNKQEANAFSLTM